MSNELTPVPVIPTFSERVAGLAVPARRVLAVIAAVLGAGLAAGAIPDSFVAVVTIVMAIATAVGVYRAPNTPPTD